MHNCFISMIEILLLLLYNNTIIGGKAGDFAIKPAANLIVHLHQPKKRSLKPIQFVLTYMH